MDLVLFLRREWYWDCLPTFFFSFMSSFLANLFDHASMSNSISIVLFTTQYEREREKIKTSDNSYIGGVLVEKRRSAKFVIIDRLDHILQVTSCRIL